MKHVMQRRKEKKDQLKTTYMYNEADRLENGDRVLLNERLKMSGNVWNKTRTKGGKTDRQTTYTHLNSE